MKFSDLSYKNIRFYTRYYRLIAVAVLIAVTVIVGSLVVGDSVRTTLVKRVTERLGNTESILFSRQSFMDEKLADSPLFDGSARGMLLTNGFISQNGKLVPVFVWGVDDIPISGGAAKVNPALLKELGQEKPDAIILRLPASGLVPSGSLFVTENYTSSMRLAYDGLVSLEEGGNISMKNEQLIPLNIFVNRKELAEAMETEGKINLILSDKKVSEEELKQVWNYSFSGLFITQKEGFTEISSDRVFLQEKVVETISRNNREPNRLFSYLANAIERDSTSIPYSFVTAMDRYKGEVLQKDEIILSDYSANRLQAKPGDWVTVSYFTSQDLKTLKTEKLSLLVKKIVPLSELQEDKSLSADFPGLSNVERCTDWDSDLPIDMSLISDEDEAYWEQYRSTPKAILSYEAVAGHWGNAYGNATAVRMLNTAPDLSELQSDMFGIQLIHPREAGLYAAKNGVDFSSLFLALGFFIIVSAMLLLIIPLSEMLYQRRHEIALLKSLGYTQKRITRILWTEAAPVVLASSVGGVILGILYTSLIMWLLGNVWKGATHTEGFAVYPHLLTIALGFLVGILLSLWLLRRTIVRSLKDKKVDNKRRKHSLKYKKGLAITASILALAVSGFNFFFLQSVILFVLVGIILIGTAALWGDYLICRNGTPSTNSFTSEKLIWSTLLANKKQAILSFVTLTMGVFIVFSVGLNRKGFADSSQIKTGTGGFSLWCESSVPVYHNMSTQAGREKLSLTALPDDAEIMQCLRYSADDASCLNLNKVSTPTVLGVDMDALLTHDFRIEQNPYPLNEVQDVYPALVDATVLTWSLGMALGDTLFYEGDRGQRVGIRLSGTLSNSIFQGHILIDKKYFSDIWEETSGSEVFLLKVDESQREEVKTLLSQALNEYGVRVTTTNDRLKQFNSVTDTYLTIFLTLGGLGLLVGIMSFIIVIRKNLSMRRKEIELYKTLGFTHQKIEQTLYKENVLIPLYAIATGVISSIVGVSISFMNTGIWVWLLAFLFTAFFIGCIILFVKKIVKTEVE
ncbi:putative ABC transport system permease protein [Parabacteroides sp. PF5-5]|uniref:ABC transporter permease n=1 Tax=unclassified Parabacteroides TaxID=2649774 RepID=UPI002472FF3B|nr:MULTISPECIES: ABC transporter permease [unclassified Parabacteroides]MDH6303726.1 putative ABC transport system permease protein [Parabacteroides sp. PH5-39]MDH6314343.1 putative ABC transport system permease protein [Parabacteroides sp. PF5-13]MDH6318592.1 putative ABC transport system permease protein [Parabacteroides sp. PH5-13]MDH6322115.1 putative ABC transport system permease protein [Parabacteroides sp. PH5-8]MDH6325805.1 putative ABC transport system permease protein [Parabacteroide